MPVINLLKSAGTPVGINRMSPQLAVGLHRHDNVELVIVIAGTGHHRTREGTWPLRRGDVFVIPVGMEHGYADSDGLEIINLGYDPARLALPLARLAALPGYAALCTLEPRLRRHQAFAGHLHLEETALVPLLALIDAFDNELRAREPGWESAAEAWLLQLLIGLARQYARSPTPEAQVALRLSRVQLHLDAHLAQPLAQDHLARIAGCSRATLQRWFRAAHGTSVIDHINHLRIARARQLLMATDQPVAEIASRCGFTDANYFARVFRRVTGLTPRAARSDSGSPTRSSRHRVADRMPSARD